MSVAIDIRKQVVKASEAATLVNKLVNRLKGEIELHLPRSMIDPKEIEAIETSTVALDSFRPEPLAELATREGIARVVQGGMGGARPGSLRGSVDDKRKIRKARDARSNEIEALRHEHAALEQLVAQFVDQRDRLDEIVQHVVDSDGLFELEVATRLTGHSLVLDLVNLKQVIYGPMEDRIVAGEAAIGRLNTVLRSAEHDLRLIDEFLPLADFLFPDMGLVPPTGVLSPHAVGGTGTAELADLRAKLAQGERDAHTVADELRREAAKARESGRGLRELKQLLEFIGNVISVAKLFSERPSVPSRHTPPAAPAAPTVRPRERPRSPLRPTPRPATVELPVEIKVSPTFRIVPRRTGPTEPERAPLDLR